MADPDTNKTQRTADKPASAAGSAADRTADAARAATDAERLQGQTTPRLDTTSRVFQEATRRTSENLDLMKRLAETMASGVREASSDMVDWTRQVSERQAEAMRQITQARSMEEVLDIQNRYIRENLQGLLDLSAKISRLSANKASEASGQLEPGDR
jgi:hypothetical protein